MSTSQDRTRRSPAARVLWLAAATVVMVGAAGAMTAALAAVPPGFAPGPNQPATADGSRGIDIANFAFAPPKLTVAPGQRVTWTNTDTVLHTSTGADKRWNSGPLAPGASFSVTFDAPGAYVYGCSIHPFMRAKVIVGN